MVSGQVSTPAAVTCGLRLAPETRLVPGVHAVGTVVGVSRTRTGIQVECLHGEQVQGLTRLLFSLEGRDLCPQSLYPHSIWHKYLVSFI